MILNECHGFLGKRQGGTLAGSIAAAYGFVFLWSGEIDDFRLKSLAIQLCFLFYLHRPFLAFRGFLMFGDILVSKERRTAHRDPCQEALSIVGMAVLKWEIVVPVVKRTTCGQLSLGKNGISQRSRRLSCR